MGLNQYLAGEKFRPVGFQNFNEVLETRIRTWISHEPANDTLMPKIRSAPLPGFPKSIPGEFQLPGIHQIISNLFKIENPVITTRKHNGRIANFL